MLWGGVEFYPPSPELLSYVRVLLSQGDTCGFPLRSNPFPFLYKIGLLRKQGLRFPLYVSGIDMG